LRQRRVLSVAVGLVSTLVAVALFVALTHTVEVRIGKRHPAPSRPPVACAQKHRERAGPRPARHNASPPPSRNRSAARGRAPTRRPPGGTRPPPSAPPTPVAQPQPQPAPQPQPLRPAPPPLLPDLPPLGVCVTMSLAGVCLP
jgi:hypothetical protein